MGMKMLWLIVALGITSLCDGRSVEVSRSKGHMAYNRQLFSSITNATVSKEFSAFVAEVRKSMEQVRKNKEKLKEVLPTKRIRLSNQGILAVSTGRVEENGVLFVMMVLLVVILGINHWTLFLLMGEMLPKSYANLLDMLKVRLHLQQNHYEVLELFGWMM